MYTEERRLKSYPVRSGKIKNSFSVFRRECGGGVAGDPHPGGHPTRALRHQPQEVAQLAGGRGWRRWHVSTILLLILQPSQMYVQEAWPSQAIGRG